MPVTQEQIARRLRVSRQLVSFALNGAPGVSPRMRDRILRVAGQLGYSSNTNQAARDLAARRNKRRVRTGVLALIIPRSYREPIRRLPFFVPWLDGVECEAAERDLALYLASCHPDRPLPRVLREGLVDGVICADQLDPRLRKTGLPVVMLGQAVPGCFGLAIADREGARKATEHLLDLGHRRLAYVGHVPEFAFARERLAGFREALAARGLPSPEELIEATLWQQEVEAGTQAVKRLLARDRSFTAVVCYNDIHAMGAARGLEEAGLRVPADVSLTGFDDVTIQYGFRPAITSIGFDRFRMGQRAVQWLCEHAGDVVTDASSARPGKQASAPTRTQATAQARAPATTTSGEKAASGEPGAVTFPVELVVRESTCPPKDLKR